MSDTPGFDYEKRDFPAARGVFGLLVLFALAACAGPDSGEPASVQVRDQVEAAGELLQGEILDEDDALVVFRGIPYAAAPVGENRWRPPAPHQPRPGVQDATRFGPACPQQQGNVNFYRFVAEQFGVSPDRVEPMENIDEDCLNLNIWTMHPAGAKKPVMVWIYGGSNVNGYAQEREYLGHNLARRDVVYVSINYRVGVMGYLAHAGLSAESEHGVSGNYGLLDQIAALQWVQQNISAFGGDPDNVTIFGESAGAANVTTLMASPLAEGLFHRAISQSGGYAADVFTDLQQAEEMGAGIAAHLGVEESSSPADTVDALRAMDWQSLVEGAAESEVGQYHLAIVDGWVLPEPLAVRFREGRLHRVELMIGANRNENYPWVDAGSGPAEWEAELEKFEAPFDVELRTLFDASEDSDYRGLLDRLGSAEIFLCPSLFIADTAADAGLPVYFYYFTRVRPGGENALAYHGAEISYVHDSVYEWLPEGPVDRKLTDTMGRYWVNFAKQGSPNADGLPDWPRYSSSKGQYQDLGDVVTTRSGLETQLCEVFDRMRDQQIRIAGSESRTLTPSNAVNP